MKLPDRIYDWLKWLVVIVLPAIGALYTGLSQIWSLPYAAEIPATITVICTFLGAVLCISTAQYNKDAAAGVSDFNTYHGTHEPSDSGDFTVYTHEPSDSGDFTV